MKKIVILLATYNGERYLREQLTSLATQSVDLIDIVASDDNSSDGTMSILDDYAKSWRKGSFLIVRGPGAGFAENFRQMLLAYSGDADYVAFCDQDDIWHADKLRVALDWLKIQSECPALYCGRTRYVDQQGNYLRMSPLFGRPPSLKNALVQSLAGGNTMVMNKRAAQLMVESSRHTGFVSHDWWAYIVVTAYGGVVYYDPEPQIDYRQHGGNVLGANDTMLARLLRIVALRQGRFAVWNAQNLKGLEPILSKVTNEARMHVTSLKRMREGNFAERLTALLRSGFYRQTLLGNFGLVVATMFRWL